MTNAQFYISGKGCIIVLNIRVFSATNYFCLLQVAKSRDFKREGSDIHSNVHISISQAILGGSIRIPGIYEEILFDVSNLLVQI